MKFNDIAFLLAGFLYSLFGVKIIFNPEWKSLHYGTVNFGENHQIIGAVILVFGALTMYSVLRKINW